METVNIKTTQVERLAEWRERNKEAIAEAMKKYEVITGVCGGKFQRKGQTEHFKTKMHINFLQQQEQLDRLQEVEDIKEQEIRDNNAEVETWKAEEKAETPMQQMQFVIQNSECKDMIHIEKAPAVIQAKRKNVIMVKVKNGLSLREK